ncbi:MAG TPA: hypothetical protein VNN18_05650 [Candidatus Xenobia bacterium]|nr:hypothetical protein [Candidatus Xenobia bacterium]
MQLSAGELANLKRLVKVLWLVLLISVCLYWPVLGLVQIERAEPPPVVTQALMLMAIADAGAALFLRFNRIPTVWLRQPLDLAALNQLRTFYILCFVLAEAVALFGMILFFLGGSREQALWFFTGSVALFLLCYPRTPESPLGIPPQ